MHHRGIGLVLSLMIGISVILSGCVSGAQSESATTAQASASTTLTISAAKSLTDAMGEISTLYAKEHPEVTLTFNFGSSGSMRQQIEQGAEVDLFMPAALKDVNALKDQGLLLEDTIRNILGNELVLVVPADSKLSLADFKEVTNPGVKKLALGEPASVPAGKYAEEVFTTLGVLDQVKAKTVYAKDVKEVLTWVETGNAEAGVVYVSEAMASDKVKVVATAPADSHSPIIYPAAVIKASKQPAAAKEFLDFLSTDGAKEVFEKYGYVFLGK